MNVNYVTESMHLSGFVSLLQNQACQTSTNPFISEIFFSFFVCMFLFNNLMFSLNSVDFSPTLEGNNFYKEEVGVPRIFL